MRRKVTLRFVEDDGEYFKFTRSGINDRSGIVYFPRTWFESDSEPPLEVVSESDGFRILD